MPSSDDIAFAPFGRTAAAHAFRPFGSPSPVTVDEPGGAADPRALAFEAGRAQGRAEAAAEHALLACEVAAALVAIGAWREELRTRYTEALVGLAVRIAGRIVGDTLAAEPERWVAIAAAAVRRLVDAEQVTVRVAPRLAALLRDHVPELAGGTTEVRVVEDASLAPDACRVESRSSDVEGGIAAQLATVAEALGVAAT